MPEDITLLQHRRTRFSSGILGRGFSLSVVAGLAAIALMTSIVKPDLWLVGLGLVALTIVMVPVAVCRFDLFSPWSFVALTVLLGTTLRAFSITAGWPHPERIEELLLLGRDPDFLRGPTLVLLLGLASLSAGYLTWRPRSRGLWVADYEFSLKRISVVVFVCLVISLIAMALYFQATGGFSSGVISGKRATIPDLDVIQAQGFSQFIVLRQLARLSVYAYVLTLTYYLFSGRPMTLRNLLLILLLLLVSCILPFYASSKLPVAWLLIATAAIWYYSTSGSRAQLRVLVGLIVWGMLTVLIISSLTSARNWRGDREDLLAKAGISEVAASFLLNRHFAGIAKTAQIVEAVPDPLEYEYGKTIAVWLVAPIPRSLWPGKPLVSSGPVLGRKVFQIRSSSGVPPGMVAELYWNFHLIGVTVGCALFGFFLRGLYEWFQPSKRIRSILIPLYVVGPMRMGFDALGTGVGYAVMQAAIEMAVMAAILFLVLVPSRRFGEE